MSHARQQILDAVVAALQLGVTATVQAGRMWAIQETELPIVAVYTNTEAQSLDEGTMADTSAIGRTLELVCEVSAQGVDGNTVNSALNAVAVELETVLGQERQVVGVHDIVPLEWDVVMDVSGETVTGRGVATFEVLYRTAFGLPETII